MESKLAELVIEHEKVVAEKEQLVRERLANQNILQETGVQIKKFEQQVLFILFFVGFVHILVL